MADTLTLKNRNPALDILRALAVLLVLLRHATLYSNPKTPITPVVAFFVRGGWVGVDLFFVLSGFLIAQLLFKEHNKYGRISFIRFFIRRGFKIYPPYYLMILVTVLLLLSWRVYRFEDIAPLLFPWLFYLQNYVQSPLAFIWGHTWSLAIEEQFYLSLPLLLILLAKTRRSKKDPFSWIPAVFVFVALACLSMRIVNAAHFPFNPWIYLTPFHVRIDSLFCGVFTAYLYQYRPLLLIDGARRYRYLLLLAGIILVSPAYCFELADTRFIYTFGYTFIYIGMAFIMIAAVGVGGTETNLLAKAAAYAGARSYSIYLWHFPIAWLIHQPQAHLSGVPLNWFYFDIPVYLTVATAFGILMSNLIELPMLTVRDRLFPSRSA